MATIRSKQFPTHFLLPAALLALFWAILYWQPSLIVNDTIALVVTIDIVVSIPVLYSLLILRQAIPKITILSVFIICMLAAGAILPADHQYWLTQFRTYTIPLAELGILAYVSWYIVRTRRAFKQAKTGHDSDFYSLLQQACAQALPKSIAKLLATEIGTIYYGCLNWRSRKLQDNEYSYHRKSGIALIVGTFMGIIMVETFAVHLLLEQWNTTAAWVASLLSLYGLLQLFALLKSMPRRPTFIGEQALHLRYGYFSEIDIALDSIMRITVSSRSIPAKVEHQPLSPLGSLSSHNMLLHLNQVHELNGLYSRPKPVQNISIYIDEVEDFIQTLQQKTEHDIAIEQQFS